MKIYPGKERRKHTRLNANFVISYRFKNAPDNYDLSQTRNVSEGGMLLTTNKKFENGTYLAITIRFPFLPKRIEVDGEVVGSREIVRDLIYETRVMFVGAQDVIMNKLGDFIKEKLLKH